MLDHRIFTFLELCQTMNYRKTAEKLNMTQPAVTQHIKYLEELYQCSLFDYSNRTLKKTTDCFELERTARAIISLNNHTAKTLLKEKRIKLNIGATKTIGEYAIESLVLKLLNNDSYEFNLTIDNTEHLLKKLDHFELDLLMIEGYFNKNNYDYKLISKQELVGICSKSHPFANKEISVEAVFHENIILREKGSGTRAVFENFLYEQNYSLDSFSKISNINSYKLIETAAEQNIAISFVYDIVPRNNKNLAIFKIKGHEIHHEFNYVFFKNSKAKDMIKFF